MPKLTEPKRWSAGPLGVKESECGPWVEYEDVAALARSHEAARVLAQFVIDHPRAAFGMGDRPHAERTEMQRLAEAWLAEAEKVSQ